jgi:hypothetical protein
MAETYKRKHSGKIDVKKLRDDISQCVFSKYTRLPERLCDLLAVSVPDPAFMVENVARKIGLADAIGKILAEKFVLEMRNEFGKDPVTAYDVAMSFLTLSRRYVSGGGDVESTKVKVETVCYRAPFVDYTASSSLVLA